MPPKRKPRPKRLTVTVARDKHHVCKSDDRTLKTLYYDLEPTTFDLTPNNPELVALLTRQVFTVWQYKVGPDRRHNVKNGVGTRNQDNTIALHAVSLDFDNDDEETRKQVAKLSQYAGIKYPSTKSTPEKPRVRVLLPLAEPITDVTRFKPICKYLKAQFPNADQKVFSIGHQEFSCCEFYDDDDGNRLVSAAHANFSYTILTGDYFEIPDSVQQTGADERQLTAPSAAPSLASGWIPPERDTDRVEFALEFDCRKGMRDDGAYGRVVLLRRIGCTPEEICDRIHKWNENHCRPPLDDDVIDEKIESAMGRDRIDIGYSNWPELELIDKALRDRQKRNIIERYPSPLPDVDLVGHKKTTREQVIDSLEAAHAVGQFKSYTLSQLTTIKNLIGPPVPVGPFLCWRENHTVLAGLGGGGKSTLARSFAIQAAQDGKHVLWVTNEYEKQALWWWDRMGGLDASLNGRIEIFDTRFINTDIPLGEERWKALELLIVEVLPDIVVFDSLLSMLSWLNLKNPESSTTDEWMDNTKRLGSLGTNIGAGVMTLHHSNKPDQNTGKEKGFTGNTGILNGCDDLYEMYTVKGSKTKRWIKMRKTRTDQRSMTVDYDMDDSHCYSVVPDEIDEPDVPDKARKLLEIFRDNGPDLTSEQIDGMGVARQTAERWLKRWGAVKDEKTKRWHLDEQIVDDALESGVLPKKQPRNPNA